MTSDVFAQRIIALTDTLYRISLSQLSQSCDREDAVQECLRKAWEKRKKLKDDRFVDTWVIRILLNECHNIQRKGKRQIPTPALPEPAAQPESADMGELKAALLELDEATRLPIMLQYVEGYPIEEVAKMLRLPVGTVKSRISRGKAKLKQRLKEEVFTA